MNRDPQWLFLVIEALLGSHLCEGVGQSVCFAIATVAILIDAVSRERAALGGGDR